MSGVTVILPPQTAETEKDDRRIGEIVVLPKPVETEFCYRNNEIGWLGNKYIRNCLP